MKLGLKLTLSIILGVSLVLAGYGYLRVDRELALFERDMDADHQAFGRALANAVEEVARRDGPDRALELVEDANIREGQVDIEWVPDTAAEMGSRVSVHGETRRLVTDVPVRGPPGPGLIRITESMEDEDRYVEQTIARTVAATATVAAVCGVIILAFSLFFVARPMERLVDKARRVGAGDLSGPLQLEQKDEIGALAVEMNAMCDRLAAAQARVEQETTARIAALEQLRHVERLATVGKLASGVAHELGTPLNVVQARAKMIARGDVTGLEAREDARTIAEQTDRMTGIIRQLLDFARVRPPRKEPVDLAGLCRRSAALLGPLAKKRAVVIAAPAADVRLEAEADSAQMEQVVTNVVMNAIHAQPDGGEVRMTLGIQEREPPSGVDVAPGRFVCLDVADDGTGIPPAALPHIFEPFFTTKDVGEGTGLGLSVAWGIVREHGGFIEVDSEPGRGTRFTVCLPASTKREGK